MFLKRIQLGLIHVAVAMTLVPIDSTLNRVMIKELSISATLFAILSSLPYIFAPVQVAIGAYSDRHPIMGFRRTPYILVGLLLCVVSLILLPPVAFLMDKNFGLGVLAGIFAFGAWGMGYNLSAVSYLSLASELSGEKERGKTIATMWFMMIVAIILTAITLGHLVDPYTPAALIRAFEDVAAAALLLGLIGLIKLEPRSTPLVPPMFYAAGSAIGTEELQKGGDESRASAAETYTLKQMSDVIMSNPAAKTFFIYLLLLLVGILGQNILLEPFAGQAFGLSVGQSTSRVNEIWGTFVLVSIIIAGLLDGRISKRIVAQVGNIGSLIGFIIIVVSGILADKGIFYNGITVLGFGTGLCTVANLSLMFDFTVPGLVGLYIGAWGFSNALSRLTGNVLGGVVFDVLKSVTGSALTGYLVVFVIEGLLLLVAAIMLSRIDVNAFQQQAYEPSFVEKVAIAAE